jgi:phosphopantothenoylcysteine decarboxylase/phosphopantothenate--cysteine ligase
VANVQRMRDDFGYRIVEPDEGPLASGQSGIGRLAALPSIVDAVVASVQSRPVRSPEAEARPPAIEPPREADLVGRHLVITAGGTSEPIDPIRSVTNRSTGRMGVALAQAALDRGARVTLIAAAVSVPLPDHPSAKIVRVESTATMRAALLDTLTADDGRPGFDALVMAAAVSDFRPARPAETKIPRGSSLTLDLEPTPDLLAEVSGIARRLGPDRAQPAGDVRPRPLIVGFAAETGSLDRAPAKIAGKGLDLLVANDVSEAGSGFGTDTNRVTIFSPEGAAEEWPLLTKREVADRILDRLAPMLDARDAAPHTGPVTQETRQ